MRHLHNCPDCQIDYECPIRIKNGCDRNRSRLCSQCKWSRKLLEIVASGSVGWCPVVGYEDYYLVSEDGYLLPRKASRFRVPHGIQMGFISGNGYRYHNLSSPSKATRKTAHSLVAESHMGSCPDGMHINHKNGNKLNNHHSNLEYVTQGDNNRHAIATGLNDGKPPVHYGDDNHSSKITTRQAAEIRQLLNCGWRQVDIAKLYGLSQSAVSSIKLEKTWKPKAALAAVQKQDGVRDNID